MAPWNTRGVVGVYPALHPLCTCQCKFSSQNFYGAEVELPGRGFAVRMQNYRPSACRLACTVHPIHAPCGPDIWRLGFSAPGTRKLNSTQAANMHGH